MKDNWKAQLVRPMFRSKRLYKLYLRYKNLNTLFYTSQSAFQTKDAIVCGMNRSGSALLYNLVSDVLRENRNVVHAQFDSEIQYKEILANEISMLVKKNHTYLPLVARRIRTGQSIGFFSHRDLRDVVVSMMQIGWVDDAEEWIRNYRIKPIENNAMLYAAIPNMHIFSYEQLTNTKSTVVKKIADVLQVSLPSETIEQICERTSLENMRQDPAHASDRNQYRFDSHMLPGHIADGRVGKWKEYLTPQEARLLTEQCQEYLDYFGYE